MQKQPLVGLDWLTGTATDLDTRRELEHLALTLRPLVEERGNAITPAGFRGYQGWRCGSLIFGARYDSSILDISGAAADEFGWRVLEVGAQPTRLDVQVTHPAGPRSGDLAEEAWRAFPASADELPRRRVARWHWAKPTGSTLYVGSPASALYRLLYDKHAEAPEDWAAGSWRYELRCRAHVARVAASELVRQSDRVAACRRFVHDRFAECGVTPRFRAAGPAIAASVKRQRSHAERRLQWIRKQVRPSVDWLLQRGHEDELARALGLAEWADIARLGTRRRAFRAREAAAHA
jgi:DNA relaxase NicK